MTDTNLYTNTTNALHTSNLWSIARSCANMLNRSDGKIAKNHVINALEFFEFASVFAKRGGDRENESISKSAMDSSIPSVYSLTVTKKQQQSHRSVRGSVCCLWLDVSTINLQVCPHFVNIPNFY